MAKSHSAKKRETTGWHRGKPTEPRPAKTGTEAERAS